MEEVLNKIATAIGQIADKHGEATVRTMLETASLMAMNDIIQSIVGLVAGIIFIIIAYSAKVDWKDLTDIDFFHVARKILGYVFGIFFICLSISVLVNPVLWKSMSDPKVYIAYSIMKKGLK